MARWQSAPPPPAFASNDNDADADDRSMESSFSSEDCLQTVDGETGRLDEFSGAATGRRRAGAST
eukprot:10236756-Alexandrium_andersonii.AAC.1